MSVIRDLQYGNGGWTGDVSAATFTASSGAVTAPAKGSLLTATSASASSYLPVGTDGHVLTADSAEVSGLKWAASGGGGGATRTAVASSPHNASDATQTLAVTATASSAVTINLPDTSTDLLTIAIKDEGGNAGTNAITVVPNGSDTIQGNTSLVIEADYAFVTLYFVLSTTTWMVGTPS